MNTKVQTIPIAIRYKDLPKLMPMSLKQAQYIFKGLKAEIERTDSKIDKKAMICSGKMTFASVKAVYWYIENKDLLEDETARLRVKKFDSRNYNSIL